MLTLLSLQTLTVVHHCHFQDKPALTEIHIQSKDKRLAIELPPLFSEGTFKDVSKWAYSSSKIFLSTTEDEILRSSELFIFKNASIGDLMNIYGILYRMRWVKYLSGRPNYELTIAKDVIDSLYLPQNDFQKQRFEYMKPFVDMLNSISRDKKAEYLSGRPFIYSSLPPDMKHSIMNSIKMVIEGNSAESSSSEKPDINNLTEAQIRVEDRSKPGAGFQELWFSLDTNIGGFNFRWNDYHKTKTNIGYVRPVSFFHEPELNEAYSKSRAIYQFRELNIPVSIETRNWKFLDLITYLHKTYSLNFVINRKYSDKILEYSCTNIPLHDVLDKICSEFGNLEWEFSYGKCVAIRSADNPRRRNLVIK